MLLHGWAAYLAGRVRCSSQPPYLVSPCCWLHCCALLLCAVPLLDPQGDSGFVVVRGGQIVLRSSPKQHFFDCPLQFGSYPEHVDDTDTADDAEVYQLPVLPGDVIIAGRCAGCSSEGCPAGLTRALDTSGGLGPCGSGDCRQL